MGINFSTNAVQLENTINQLKNVNKRLEERNQSIIKAQERLEERNQSIIKAQERLKGEHEVEKESYASQLSREQSVIIQKDKEIGALRVELLGLKHELSEYEDMKSAFARIDGIVDQFGNS